MPIVSGFMLLSVNGSANTSLEASYLENTYSYLEYQVLLKNDFSEQTDFIWLLQQVENNQLPCFSIIVTNAQIALKIRHYLALIVLPSGKVLEILPKISDNLSSSSSSHKAHKRTEKQEADSPRDHKQQCLINARQQSRSWVGQMLHDIFLADISTPALTVSEAASFSRHQLSVMERSWLYPFMCSWLDNIDKFAPIKEYHSNQLNHPTAQGKLLIKQQLRHNSLKPHYRYTRDTEFIVSPLWSRLFYTVWLKLSSVDYLLTKQRPSVLNHIMTMNNCLLSPQSLILSAHQFQSCYDKLWQMLATSNTLDTNNVALGKQLLRLSKLILQLDGTLAIPFSTSHKQSAKDYAITTIIDMNLAFEKWVSQHLATLYDSVCTQTQFSWLEPCQHESSVHDGVQLCHEAGKSSFDEAVPTDQMNNKEGVKDTKIKSMKKRIIGTEKHIRPDLLILDKQQQVSIVVDIKYKQLSSKQQLSSADLYQVFTYLSYFNAQQAWLIFPKTDKFKQAYQFKVKNNLNLTNCYIRVLPFDVLKKEIIF